MNKLVTLTLAILFVFSFTSCGGKNEAGADTPKLFPPEEYAEPYDEHLSNEYERSAQSYLDYPNSTGITDNNGILMMNSGDGVASGDPELNAHEYSGNKLSDIIYYYENEALPALEAVGEADTRKYKYGWYWSGTYRGGKPLTIDIRRRYDADTYVIAVSYAENAGTPVWESYNALSPNAMSGADIETDEVFVSFKELAEKGKTIIHWYRGDVYDGNDNGLAIEFDGSELENPDLGNSYKKVGKFGTIAEMKAATEEVFTKEFCNTLLYGDAFTDASGEDRPLYKENDGVLHRNIYGGGFSWPFQLTDNYDIALLTEDLAVLTVKCNVLDWEQWYNCVIKKENESWKIEKLYTYSPYQDIEDKIESAVSAWFCAQDWDNVNNMNANTILVFYKNQYLSNVKAEDYNDVNGYPVPANEVMIGLAKHFDGLRIETLKKVNDEKYSSAVYDESTDSFIFYITFDPADFVILSKDSGSENTVLNVLVISKSGKASYWGALKVKPTTDSFRYLSNKYTDIPEE